MIDAFALIAMTSALAHGYESKHDAKLVSEAKTPAELSVILDYMARRDDHRRALEVARAGAPRTTVTVKNYW